MKKIIDMGKIDLNAIGRKINKVTIELELEKDSKNRDVFSASASVWNISHTDIIMGGQCIEDLFPFFKYNRLYLTILDLWKKYHLNDMHAGTENQENYIENLKRLGYPTDYESIKKDLEEVGLYNDNGYQYGTAWLYREIPTKDLKLIASIILGD